MKRSEAIKELQDIILTHMNCPSDCCGDDTTMYSKILADIERRLGMLPPDDKCIVFGWNEGYISPPEWEEE